MTEENNAKNEARAQYESIVAMVAALECHYAHLEEMQDAKREYDDEHGDGAWEREYPSIAEELAALAGAAGDCESREEAERAIYEDPLSIEVRAGWYIPTGDRSDAEEFQILLCTGGPAVRIMGELDQHLQPARAWLEYQDWYTPWTKYSDVDQATLLVYCQQFFFGE